MPKHKPEKIEEAKKLRLEGLSYDKIAKQISVSSMTLKRWNKRGYLKGVSNKETENKPDATGDTENVENKKLNDGNKSEGGNESNKEITGNSFHSLNVTFVTKTGGFTLEGSAGKTEAPAKANEPARELAGKTTSEISAVNTEIKAGLGQSSQVGHKTEHHDIDEPENVLDNFFNRGLVETLVPVGLLLAGYMISGKKGIKGEHREDRGDSW